MGLDDVSDVPTWTQSAGRLVGCGCGCGMRREGACVGRGRGLGLGDDLGLGKPGGMENRVDAVEQSRAQGRYDHQGREHGLHQRAGLGDRLQPRGAAGKIVGDQPSSLPLLL